MNLLDYQKRINLSLREAVHALGEKNQLRDACEYALLSGGKRLRPLLVLLIADAMGHSLDVMDVALSVEFFHTASLIADDLPSMDNDDVRRGKAALHQVYPESVAILASYTLIAAGYGGIYKSREKMRRHFKFKKEADEVALFCLDAVTKCAGMQGATQGQFLDLYQEKPSFEEFKKIVEMKTSSLFEISFLFGFLFGGGEMGKMEEVRQCARHLGMAFQIGDDLEDDLQDENRKEGMNITCFYSKEEAYALFEEEFFAFRKALEGLGLWTEPMQELFYSLDTCQRLPAGFFS